MVSIDNNSPLMYQKIQGIKLHLGRIVKSVIMMTTSSLINLVRSEKGPLTILSTDESSFFIA